MSDLIASKQNYYSSSYSSKREIVLLLLELYKGKWETFDMMYNHILNTKDILESDLDEVFESMFSVIYDYSEQKQQNASNKLSAINQRLNQMKELEKKERESEDIDNNLDNMLNKI